LFWWEWWHCRGGWGSRAQLVMARIAGAHRHDFVARALPAALRIPCDPNRGQRCITSRVTAAVWERLQSRHLSARVKLRTSHEAQRIWSKSFRTAARRESLLFCLSKRDVTKRKRHPIWRLPGCARQVREPGAGFSTAHPCAGEKASTSCRCPLRGLSTPTHRRIGEGGSRATTGEQKQSARDLSLVGAIAAFDHD